MVTSNVTGADTADDEPEVPQITDPQDLTGVEQVAQELSQAVPAPLPGGGPGGGQRSLPGGAAGLAPVAVIDRTNKTDPNVYDNRPNGVNSITGILLHHTGSASEDGDIYWLSQMHDNPVSVHKVIKRNGVLVKLVNEDKRAWHAGLSSWRGVDDCNNTMIGYEICNRGDGEAFTDAQYNTVAQSIAYDCAVYHIPDVNVTTHQKVRDAWLAAHPDTAAKKNDPLGLDMNRLWNLVREVRQNWPFAPTVPLWSDPPI